MNGHTFRQGSDIGAESDSCVQMTKKRFVERKYLHSSRQGRRQSGGSSQMDETFDIIKHDRFGFVETEALARVSTIWKYREREAAEIDS
jgi:hypothetical protein